MSTTAETSKIVGSITPVSNEESAKWEWEHSIKPRMAACGWRERFCQRVSWPCRAQRQVYQQCRNGLSGTGAVLALVGPRGLGKTTITAQIALDRVEAFWAYYTAEKRKPLTSPIDIPLYRKMTDLIARFKVLYSDFGGIDVEELMARRDAQCRDVSLLVIDEVHECDDQRLKDRILTDLVDRRYMARTDTVLISNQTAAEFRETTNDSVLSRLSEHGMIIPCSWPSFRERL